MPTSQMTETYETLLRSRYAKLLISDSTAEVTSNRLTVLAGNFNLSHSTSVTAALCVSHKALSLVEIALPFYLCRLTSREHPLWFIPKI